MSFELLHHCIERLTKRPHRLVIHQPLTNSEKVSFIRYWAKSRFELQQESIIHLHPDHPDYAKGHLHSYALEWTEDTKDPNLWRLKIARTTNPGLSPRELILWASATKASLEVPFSSQLFKKTKARMLGKDSKRNGGSILHTLRPAVANVLYSNRGGQGYIRAWNMTTDITTEDD